ncbi:MAG: ATP-dependent Clp protease adapter ClpS [Nitrospirae bacterium]|nr:ATP-dependent Clp protease adapter ClpS [Nitrospirota bacterium]
MGNSGQKTGADVEVRERQKIEVPPLYSVFLVNDDYTTMDFVIFILEKIFHKSPVEATRIMLHVHKKGKGLAGLYTRDIAETKVTAVHDLAQENEFPLRCLMEKE